MLELIKKRRSIRSYTNEPVSDADVKALTAEKLRALTIPAELSKAPAAVLKNFTVAQLRAIPPETLKAITPEDVPTMSPAKI